LLDRDVRGLNYSPGANLNKGCLSMDSHCSEGLPTRFARTIVSAVTRGEARRAANDAITDLRNFKRRFKVNMEAGFPDGDPSDVKHEWVKAPGDPEDREVCVFVTYNPAGSISDHALTHARAWAAQGYMVVLVVVLDDLSQFDATQDLGFSSGILVRENIGYDFGAWAAAIRQIPNLENAETMAMVNDSIYGPLEGFGALIDRVGASTSDVIGATESHQYCSHLQSYLVFFKRKALQSAAFWKFWRGVRVGNREQAIWNYELRLKKLMEAGGLKVEALFPIAADLPHDNPTLTRWKELTDEGFPYIKAQLLRDNPYHVSIDDWRVVTETPSFSPALIEAHLGASDDESAEADWPSRSRFPGVSDYEQIGRA
jgi:hypothetical protein